MPPINSTPESRMWAALAHLSALAGSVFPFGSILLPLIIWLLKRDEMPFVNDQGKEAINFNISATLYTLAATALILISVFLSRLLEPILSLLLIGVPLLIGIVLGWLIFVLIAAVQANEGTVYRYPLTLRLLR